MKVCQTCSRRYPDNALICPEDGRELITLRSATGGGAPQDPLLGRRMFGDYVIESKLGEGGMGAVYLARHLSIDQSIAIKVLHGRAAQRSELLQRFNREARAIAKLTHPNVIRVFIFGHTDDGLVYLAMEYVAGGSLRHLIEKQGRLSELQAVYVLKQVLAAVAEAHELGIIHRDLKPDNILLTRYRGNDSFVKVVDFGIAKVNEPDGRPQAQLTQAGVVYGTPEYLSPEQAQALPLDHRSDLYSLGVILWEMLTGQLPYTGDTAMSVLVQHAFDPPPNPEKSPVPISPCLREVLGRALAKKPEERFATAAEFIEAVDACERKLLGGKSSATQVWQPPPSFPEAQRGGEAQGGRVPATVATSVEIGARESVSRRAVILSIIVGTVLLVLMLLAILLLKSMDS
jgi:serine/threonine protein kinase